MDTELRVKAKAWREQHGYTQSEMAELVGYGWTENAYYQWENGKAQRLGRGATHKLRMQRVRRIIAGEFGVEGEMEISIETILPLALEEARLLLRKLENPDLPQHAKRRALSDFARNYGEPGAA